MYICIYHHLCFLLLTVIIRMQKYNINYRKLSKSIKCLNSISRKVYISIQSKSGIMKAKRSRLKKLSENQRNNHS